MWLSGIAVAVPVNNNAFNTMILMNFLASFLSLSLCYCKLFFFRDEIWWIFNRSLIGKLDFTLICKIYQNG